MAGIVVIRNSCRREMARLQRSCRRLIWLNPLLGAPGYQPLTQGIRAALPYVDAFLPVHNLESLEALADMLRRWMTPHRYEAVVRFGREAWRDGRETNRDRKRKSRRRSRADDRRQTSQTEGNQ